MGGNAHRAFATTRSCGYGVSLGMLGIYCLKGMWQVRPHDLWPCLLRSLVKHPGLEGSSYLRCHAKAHMVCGG